MKKINLLSALAVAVIGLQIPSTAVSADVVSRQDTAVTAAVDYGSDEIYNQLSDSGKRAYEQSPNVSSERFNPTLGLKKKALTFALRYGGRGFGRVLDLLNEEAGNYVLEHANLIADTLDGVSSGFRGAVVQALIRAGVPHSYASTIGWAIEQVLM